MPALLQCLSHSPLKGYVDPAADTVEEVASLMRALSDELHAFAPQLIVLFAPDHYNGFFLDNMPQICIGMQASSVGDYRSSPGALDVPRAIAEACHRYVVAQDFDVSSSYRMQIDHGFSQPLEELTGALDRYPVLPIFINSVAPPLISCARARKFGCAIGAFAGSLGIRVAYIGSGGLSHNPPIPEIATCPPEVAERIVAGRNPTPEARAARQARTIEAATRFAAGTSELRPLNPAWDRAFMHQVATRDWAALDAIGNAELTSAAGASGHESKTWIAACAAFDAASAGRGEFRTRYYRAIPEWIAGFGAMSGSAP